MAVVVEYGLIAVGVGGLKASLLVESTPPAEVMKIQLNYCHSSDWV